VTPALPLDEAGPYVAAAYLVFVLLILVYVAIMASKLGRLEREIVELADLVEARDEAAAAPAARERQPVS
jgi:CcmD family protein